MVSCRAVDSQVTSISPPRLLSANSLTVYCHLLSKSIHFAALVRVCQSSVSAHPRARPRQFWRPFQSLSFQSLARSFAPLATSMFHSFDDLQHSFLPGGVHLTQTRPSHCAGTSLVPQSAKVPTFAGFRETTPLLPVSKLMRAETETVPAGWLASQQRAGKADSVRFG